MNRKQSGKTILDARSIFDTELKRGARLRFRLEGLKFEERAGGIGGGLSTGVSARGHPAIVKIGNIGSVVQSVLIRLYNT